MKCCQKSTIFGDLLFLSIILIFILMECVSCTNIKNDHERQQQLLQQYEETSPVVGEPMDIAFDSANNSRSLLDLEKRWYITEPEFAYIDHQFILHWKVSDYIQDRFASYSVYDGFKCKEGSNDITNTISNYNKNQVHFQNLGLQPDSTTPPNDIGAHRDIRLFLAVQPTAADSPVFYYTNEGEESKYNGLRAKMDFCVRFSLYNEDPTSPNAVEVNFQETLVSFFADLTDGFEVQDVYVKSKDKTERDAFLECEITAYECDELNQPLVNPGYLRNQGTETRVCVELSEESKAEGLYLDRIIWFYFIRTHEDGDLIQQHAIIPDSLAALSGLTDYNCMRGVEICPFTTILRADFFAWSGVGIVRGIGEGLCQFGASPFLVEDIPKRVGERMGWVHHIYDRSYAKKVTITGFPVGTTITYSDIGGESDVSIIVENDDYALVLAADNDVKIRIALDTLTLTAPLHSDINFNLNMTILTSANEEHFYLKRVAVLAVADPPKVTATESLQLEEDGQPLLLQVNPDRSADEDNSESLSVRIIVPFGKDGLGKIGSIIQTSPSPDISISGDGTSDFRVYAIGPDPATREAKLDAYLSNSIAFKPRDHWSGILTGENGLKVVAISTEASGQVAPANSEEDGTLGDMDTRTEESVTYVDITVIPVNDIPYLTSLETIVQENKLNSDFDTDLVLPIGNKLGLMVDDMDGSQSLDAQLTGFPTNALDLIFGLSRDGVNATTDISTGTVAINGTNVVDVLAVLDSLTITLAHDDDRNFRITIEGISADRNEAYQVSDSFYLEHQVIVQAVADTPTLDVGATTKSLSAENAALSLYPVTIGLNDVDGSESYQGRKVEIVLSTPTAISVGAEPVVEFGNSEGVTIEQLDGTVKLTGDGPALEAAMKRLMIRPGDHNGEDITVTVTVTSFESNPSELGPGEIAVPTVESVETFVVPIDPVIQGTPTLTLPTLLASGLEDSQIDLGTIVVGLNGLEDTDQSEIYYVEVLKSSYPERTKFFINGLEKSGTLIDNTWLRLPGSKNAQIQIKPPPNFSGMIYLSLRGHIIDYTTNGQASAETPPQSIDVSVFPEADNIYQPSSSTVGVEDLGPVPFGSTLATTGIQPVDDGTGRGNNRDSETISQITFIVPENTDALTYDITGTYAPLVPGSIPGIGSSEVALGSESRTYVITSTIITTVVNIADLTIAQREQAENDIRDTLATFQVEIGPEHNDHNGIIDIIATTLDVNLQTYDIRDISFSHAIVIQAVADVGGVFTHNTIPVSEDGSNVPLKIDVSRSADDDNSESLSVRITVPSDSFGTVGTIVGNPPTNVNFFDQGDGIYLITSSGETPAQREVALNSFVSVGDLAFDPRSNFAGDVILQVDVISTEAATGDEVAGGEHGGNDNDSSTETVTGFIEITVLPVADIPTVAVKGIAAGPEDTMIDVPVSVTLTDMDGSETFVMEIDGTSVPSGAKIFGQDEIEITKTGGVYVLQPADVDALKILPPLHTSSPLQGDIVLQTTTVVTDSTSAYENFVNYQFPLSIRVDEVSDQPNSRSVHAVATEDLDYPIGQFIGDLSGILVDTDGSETLSLVIGGLPAGAIATTENQVGISYIGNGEWQVDENVVPSLKVTANPNYAGEDPYPTIVFRAVSQEIEGDESSQDWSITFDVYPVADGFESWDPSARRTEAENEVQGLGVPLGNASNYVLADSDSEYVVEFYFDLSNLIVDAGIGRRLEDLTGQPGADLDVLIENNYLEGTFSYDSNSGKVTVDASDIAGLKLSSVLFLDSNQDFELPVSALVQDMAIIDGSQVIVEVVEDGIFQVELVGTADIPTIIADSISGDSKIRASLGGDITDTDVALGRKQSESLYFIVSSINPGGLPGYSFVDSNDNVIGFDGGLNTWLLTKDDIVTAEASGGLFFTTRDAPSVVTPESTRMLQETASPSVSSSENSTLSRAEFGFMAVVNEDDGDLTTVSKEFNVTFWDHTVNDGGAGSPSKNTTAPELPVVSVGPHFGLEDTSMDLDISAIPAPSDTTNPTVSVVISAWPEGMEFEGSFRKNHVTGTFVALAGDVKNGGITVTPPKDFSGNLEILVEVIAVNANYLSTTTGVFSVSMYFDPVADDVDISLPSLQGREDETTLLPFTLLLQDSDDSETLGPHVYVQVCDHAILNGNYPSVMSGDADSDIDGVNVVGYQRVPTNEASLLSMEQDQYWHGLCPISVVAQSIETLDDVDEDSSKATEVTFDMYIEAVANPPLITAPGSISGPEDSSIAIPGLSAESVDTVADNGHESLSVTFSEVPDGSLFNFGTNGGNGIWTIPLEKLDVLEFEPPQHYAGSFIMIYTAISKELDGGDEASSMAEIEVEVIPVADSFLMVAEKVILATGSTTGAPVQLNINMDDTRGNVPGELPEEIITLTFTSIPPGVSLTTTVGGELNRNGSGTWIFSGTESQSNGLKLIGSATLGEYTIDVSGFTTDGDSMLDPPISDTFILEVVPFDGTSSGRRSLQKEVEFMPGIFDEEGQGIRHCDSVASVPWDTGKGINVMPRISLEEQSYTSVTFSLSPNGNYQNVNWMAVLFPLVPSGDNTCPVTVDYNEELVFTANCYDYLAQAYIYVNVNDVDSVLGDSIDAYIPRDCDVPAIEKGKTVVYALSLPCSACSRDDGNLFGDENPTRRRRLGKATNFVNDINPYSTEKGDNTELSSLSVSNISLFPSTLSLQETTVSRRTTSGAFEDDIILPYPDMVGPPRGLLLNALNKFKQQRRVLQDGEEEGEGGGSSLLGPASKIELEFLAVGEEKVDSSDAARILGGQLGGNGKMLMLVRMSLSTFAVASLAILLLV